MRTHKRSLALTAVLATSGMALVLTAARPVPVWPPYLAEWQTIYPSSTTDDNVIAAFGLGCAVCHFSPGGGTGWNPYGWEIRQKFLSGLTIHDAILSAEFFDSDANPISWANLTEIGANTQPGWTPGPNNTYYDDSITTPGQDPLAGIGTLDPASGPMVPLCTPGEAGVIACPCSNPPSGTNRGCNNSAATTGAALTGTGTASLGGDTLVFTTAGEKPTATSIVLQGTTSPAVGAVYGQGVRCAGGTLKRLFTKTAAAGSVTVPDFGMGDPSVSARSAAKGDTIGAGQSRWYLVYYRDPILLGGCPAASTFNATQTGRVDWQL